MMPFRMWSYRSSSAQLTETRAEHGSCRHRRRARWWRGVAREHREVGRTRPSLPRRSVGSAQRHAPPGNDADTAVPRSPRAASMPRSRPQTRQLPELASEWCSEARSRSVSDSAPRCQPFSIRQTAPPHLSRRTPQGIPKRRLPGRRTRCRTPNVQRRSAQKPWLGGPGRERHRPGAHEPPDGPRPAKRRGVAGLPLGSAPAAGPTRRQSTAHVRESNWPRGAASRRRSLRSEEPQRHPK